MKTKFFGKFGNIVRRAFCGMLCLVFIFQSIQFASADVANSYEAYEWTLISSEAELKSYVEQSSDQAGGRRLIDHSKETILNNDEQWFKALIVYKVPNGDYYFFSGSSTCDGGKAMAASRVMPSYNFKIGEKKFTTISGYYAPYIKYAGDYGNGAASRFYLRTSADKSEALGTKCFVGNMSWYGIKYHACNKDQLYLTDVSDPKGHDFGNACNWTIETTFVISWTGCYANTFRAFYDVYNTADRWWAYPDGDYYMTTGKSPVGPLSSFYLYVGRPVGSAAVKGNVTIQSGYTTTYNNIAVTETGSITVPKNAYLVIDGDNNINNGKITVDGGMLIIKGVLDTSQYKKNYSPTYLGTISIKNGGTLIVEDTGLIVARAASADLYLSGGSVCVISGSVAIGGMISLNNSTLTVREGGALIHGTLIGGTVNASLLSRDKLYRTYSGKYLDYFAHIYTTAELNAGTYDFSKDYAGCLYVSNNSTFEGNGLYFRAPHGSKTVDSTSTIAIYESSNGYATINSMMSVW